MEHRVSPFDRQLMALYHQFAQRSVAFNQLMALLSTNSLVKGAVIWGGAHREPAQADRYRRCLTGSGSATRWTATSAHNKLPITPDRRE